MQSFYQCTDNLVNKVTRTLFQKYKTPQDYLNVDIEELQNDIRSIGLYRNKAKNIQKLCQSLLEQFNGQIPSTHKELESLVESVVKRKCCYECSFR